MKLTEISGKKLLRVFSLFGWNAVIPKSKLWLCMHLKRHLGAMWLALMQHHGDILDRSPEKLSWGEMAALAVLPNAPALVHPGKNREVLLKKRNALLDKLLANNIIDKSACYLSKLEPLPGEPVSLPQLAPHLLQRFKGDAQINKNLPSKLKTTLDINLQKNVIDILNQHHNVLKGNGINNACALVLDVETGNVLAYVGNIYNPSNPELESDVDVIKAPRSPGSALKPILYAAMFSDGMILTQLAGS